IHDTRRTRHTDRTHATLHDVFARALLNAIPLWRGVRRAKGWTGRGKFFKILKISHLSNTLPLPPQRGGQRSTKAIREQSCRTNNKRTYTMTKNFFVMY